MLAGNHKIQLELLDLQDRMWALGQNYYADTSSLCGAKQLGTGENQPIEFVKFSLPIALPAGEYQIILSFHDQSNAANAQAQNGSGGASSRFQITTRKIGKNHKSITASELYIENPFFVDMREMRFLGYTALRMSRAGY